MGGFADQVTKHLMDVLHEQSAQAVAERMRELGRTDADNIQLDLQSDSDDPSLKIDEARVKNRVREILQTD